MAWEAIYMIWSMIQRKTLISKSLALSKDLKKGPHQIKVVRAANWLVTISSKTVALRQTQKKFSIIVNLASGICVKVIP